MNHLKWMGWEETILNIQQNLRNDEKSCDVTIVAREKSVKAHRFVLSSSSDFLRDLLDGIPIGHEAKIIMPDIKGTLLESVLNFIYIGETNLSSATLTDFLETISVLGIKSAISFECATATNCEPDDPQKSEIEIHDMEDDFTEGDSEHGTLEKMDHEQEQTIESGNERELEFLEVYQEPQKLAYSFEHNYENSSGGAFIITDASGSITIADNKTVAANETNVALGNCDINSLKEKEDNSECFEADVENEEGTHLTDEQMIVQFDSTADSSTAAAALADRSEDNDVSYSKSETSDGGEDYKYKPRFKVNTSSNYGEFQAQRNENLELAAIAVVDEGMSLQKAAQKYSISKTVLWRRVKKHPLYMKIKAENPIIAKACERLTTGDSLKNISQSLDIPMSTLHRHKVRLAQEGRLPEYVTFKKRGPLSKEVLKEKLAKALKACIDNGMSQNYAANLFEVPKSTLWRHLQKRLAAGEIVADVKEEVILS